MRLTEREQDTPNGLSRFLLAHEDCPRGLEVHRDGDLVTVICHGCESSFSYVTGVAPHEQTEVEQALRGLATEPGHAPDPVPEPAPRAAEEPAEAPLDSSEPPIVKAVRIARGRDRASEAKPSSEDALPAGKPERLPPPGPLARRRRRRAGSTPLRWTSRAADHGAALGRAISRRRRPIAMAALALGGAYVVVALSAGSEPSSSDTATPLGGPNLPLEAEAPAEPAPPSGALAEKARTLETGEVGAPDAVFFTGPADRFELTLPPEWTTDATVRGSTKFESGDGSSEILIRVRGAGDSGVAELADDAAKVLAERLPDGARISRIPSRSEGELLAVARGRDGGAVSTAYIAEASGLQYLVIAGHTASASALTRLQEDSVIRSFRTGPGS